MVDTAVAVVQTVEVEGHTAGEERTPGVVAHTEGIGMRTAAEEGIVRSEGSQMGVKAALESCSPTVLGSA